MPTRLERNLALTEDLTKASNHWGRELQKSLDARFGKDRVGFMLILATSGEGGTMTFKTSLKLSGAVAFLRELADKISQGMSGIVRPN